jgi:hypothetical protein
VTKFKTHHSFRFCSLTKESLCLNSAPYRHMVEIEMLSGTAWSESAMCERYNSFYPWYSQQFWGQEHSHIKDIQGTGGYRMNVATHLHLVPPNRIYCTLWYRMWNNLTFCLILPHNTIPNKCKYPLSGRISFHTLSIHRVIIILYLSVFKCNAGLLKGFSQYAVPCFSTACNKCMWKMDSF